MTERVQGLAAAYVTAEDTETSRRQWKALQDTIREIVQRKGIIDQSPAPAHETNAGEERRQCRIVNYGQPPGKINVQRGCFHRQCEEVRGKFSVSTSKPLRGRVLAHLYA